MDASAAPGVRLSPAPRLREAPRAAARRPAASPPERTTAWPRKYLWPSTRGTGICCQQPDDWRRFRARSSPGRDRSDIRDDSAAMDAARQQQVPRLTAKNVTVRAALIAAPRICPLEPSMPEGTSTERIGFFVPGHSLRRNQSLGRPIEIASGPHRRAHRSDRQNRDRSRRRGSCRSNFWRQARRRPAADRRAKQSKLDLQILARRARAPRQSRRRHYCWPAEKPRRGHGENVVWPPRHRRASLFHQHGTGVPQRW